MVSHTGFLTFGRKAIKGWGVEENEK